MSSERNAIIDDAYVSLERGSILDVWVILNYGNGACQGFGGYVLGGFPGTAAGRHAMQPNLAGEYLVRLMRVAGVDRFDRMIGKAVRVRRAEDTDGEDGSVESIGHVTEDIWLSPKADLRELKRFSGLDDDGHGTGVGHGTTTGDQR